MALASVSSKVVIPSVLCETPVTDDIHKVMPSGGQVCTEAPFTFQARIYPPPPTKGNVKNVSKEHHD